MKLLWNSGEKNSTKTAYPTLIKDSEKISIMKIWNYNEILEKKNQLRLLIHLSVPVGQCNLEKFKKSSLILRAKEVGRENRITQICMLPVICYLNRYSYESFATCSHNYCKELVTVSIKIKKLRTASKFWNSGCPTDSYNNACLL